MHSHIKLISTIGLSSIFTLCLNVLPDAARAERYAVLIGVAKYGPGITQLPYDVKDVDALRRALISNAGYPKEHVKVMTTDLSKDSPEYPSRGNIVVMLSNLQKELKDQDSLLVYFSGHGISEQGKQYLLGADANIGALRGTGLDLETLHESLNAIRMSQLVTILDTCRNDPSPALPPSDVKDLTKELTKGLDVKAYDIFKTTKVPAHMEIFACGDQERARVLDDGRQNSVFTYFFVEGIRRNAGNTGGKLSGENLFEYASDKVQEWAAQKKVQQNPVHYIAGTRAIIIADRIRSFAPATLDRKGLESDVTLEVSGRKYDPKTNQVELDDELGDAAITLRKPGFKPQVQKILLKSDTTATVTAGPWEVDNNYRLRLVLPHLLEGYQWGKLTFDTEVINLTEDNNKRPLQITGNQLNVRGTVMDFFLSKPSVKFALSITKKPKNDDPINFGPTELNGGDTYSVNVDQDRVSSVKPLETVFLKTPSNPGIRIYVVPAGADYRVSRKTGSVRIDVQGENVEGHPSGSQIELKMGLDEEKTFWILYESGGKVRRRVVQVTKNDSTIKIGSILNGTVPRAAILEFPSIDEETPKTTLDLAALPPDAKGTVTVEEIAYPFDGSHRQISLELESHSAEAQISIKHPEFDPTAFNVHLTSGQPWKLANEADPRRRGALLIKFVSDNQEPLSIVAVKGDPTQDLLPPNGIKAKIGAKLRVTLSQPGYYLLEKDVSVAPDMLIYTIPMVKHSVNAPAEALVRPNKQDAAPMIYIPDGQHKVGVPTPDGGNELAAGTAPGGYWIYAYPVTVGQYYSFRHGANHPRGISDKEWNASSRVPITHITSDEAHEYAKWAGGDLPTEQEWEIAARGSGSEIYPWKASKWDRQKAKAWPYDADKTVGSVAENHSSFGVSDIWGHVREWTLGDGGAIVRGSSVKTRTEKQARLTWHTTVAPGTAHDDVGFRVVIKEPEAH